MSSASQIRIDLISLFTDEGRSLRVRRNEGTSYDPTQGIVPESTDDEEFEGIGRIGNYRDAVIDGNQIKKGDRRVTFIPSETDYFDPLFDARVGDIVETINQSEQYYVVDAQKRELGGELISWTLQVRNIG